MKRSYRSKKTREMMYFGKQQLVHTERELWHSRIWGESLLACSGQFAYYSGSDPAKDREVDIIAPGDVVQIQIQRPCSSSTYEQRYARVRQVCSDFKFRDDGAEVVLVEPIISLKEFLSSEENRSEAYSTQIRNVSGTNLERLRDDIRTNQCTEDDFILLEGVELVCDVASVSRETAFRFTQNPITSANGLRPARQPADATLPDPRPSPASRYISRIINLKGDREIRDIVQRHILQGELEMAAFGGRKKFIASMVRTDGKRYAVLPPGSVCLVPIIVTN